MVEPGLSFGTAAAEYERGRPEWPPELLDELPLPASATVVDVGAGTGKLTRLLESRYAHVIAVEPDDSMRSLLDAGEVRVGTAESLPLEDESVDGVFAADAFHWFDGQRAVAEFARVLRPRGVLALLWNRFDPADYVLPEDMLPEVSPKHRRISAGAWREAFEAAPFERVREHAVVCERDVTRTELLDYFASVSPITRLSGVERAATLSRVAEALPLERYARRWSAVLYWTRRK